MLNYSEIFLIFLFIHSSKLFFLINKWFAQKFKYWKKESNMQKKTCNVQYLFIEFSNFIKKQWSLKSYFDWLKSKISLILTFFTIRKMRGKIVVWINQWIIFQSWNIFRWQISKTALDAQNVSASINQKKKRKKKSVNSCNRNHRYLYFSKFLCK